MDSARNAIDGGSAMAGTFLDHAVTEREMQERPRRRGAFTAGDVPAFGAPKTIKARPRNGLAIEAINEM
jgi:hypothetical protein